MERMNDHDAPVDERFTAAYWDERYGTAERIWSGAPNAQLVAEVTDLPPGTALDAGCGEGGDAHWLAGQGWRVTALDVSEVALRRAAAHAPAEVADRITLAAGRLHGVGAGRCGVRPGQRPVPALPERAARPGLRAPGRRRRAGRHAADRRPRAVRAAHRGAWGHDHEPDMFFTAEQLAADLDPAAWEVLVTDSRPRVAQVDGREVPISDAVLRARRR